MENGHYITLVLQVSDGNGNVLKAMMVLSKNDVMCMHIIQNKGRGGVFFFYHILNE
jgi:hypothetical protein